jgi:S-adenosylmethionine:diacylglycerol 3-amino-3-carboxypropyl transferase
MFAEVGEHHFGDFFGERFRDNVTRRPQADNYFLHQVVFGRYLLDRRRGTPQYLAVDGYAEAQRNAHKLSVHVAPIDAFLSSQRDVDAVLLSNVFDWAPPDARDRIAERAVQSLSRGATLLYRHMLASPTLPEPIRLGTRIDEEWGNALCAVERSLLYRRVVVATRSA